MSGVLFGDDIAVDNVYIVNGVSSFEKANEDYGGDLKRSFVSFEDGLINICDKNDCKAKTVIDGSECFLIPGFVDLQLNDFLFLDSNSSPDEHVERLRKITMAMFEEGVTSFVLTSLASPWDELISYLKGVDSFRKREFSTSFENATLPMCFDGHLVGAMVEGTFMNKNFRGCHNEKYVHELVQGQWEKQVDEIIETGSIFAINIAPETNLPECLKFIEKVKKQGILVAVGHCQPTGAQLKVAIDKGVDYVVHLGNGSTGHSWKKFHDGGMLEECLRNDNIHVTIIADGFHVSSQYVRDWIQRKELERVSFVTDRAFALGAPDQFTVFGIHGKRDDTEEGSFLRVYKEGDPTAEELLDPLSTLKFTLMGSEAQMKRIFENALNWYTAESFAGIAVRNHPSFKLAPALSIASTLCSLNPARLAKVDGYTGKIKSGYMSNCLLVKVEQQGKRKILKIQKVFIGKRKK